MEAFSLLKYWRGGGSAGGGIAVSDRGESSSKPAVLTSAAALSATDTDDDDDEPFFDLDIAVNETATGGQQSRERDNAAGEFGAAEEGGQEEAPESDTEFNLTLSSASSNSDANLSLSPSDDGLFFKGRLVPIIEPLFAGTGKTNLKAQFPVSLKKSATKLRVFMRGLKKSKPESNNVTISDPDAPPEDEQAATAAAEVPVKYLLTREHISDEDRRFALQRYLKKVKPLYVRVSKRYGQNVAVKGSPEDGEASIGASGKLRKLREVSKHLGKTRSAVDAAPPRSRRDDSLLELQDGIQRAILHCKRSFNLTSSPAGSESNMILRSVSDPLQAKPPRESEEEEEDDNTECCV